jgi:hypothetical protein
MGLLQKLKVLMLIVKLILNSFGYLINEKWLVFFIGNLQKLAKQKLKVKIIPE